MTHLNPVVFHGHLGCFHILTIISSAATDIGMHVSLSIKFLSSPGIYPGVELLNHMVALFLVF